MDGKSSQDRVYFVSYWMVGAYVIITALFVTTVGVAVHAANTKCSCPAGLVRVEPALSPVDAIRQSYPKTYEKAEKNNQNNQAAVEKKREITGDDLDYQKVPSHRLSPKFHLADRKSQRGAEETVEKAAVVCPSTPVPGTDQYWTSCTDYAWTQTQCAPQARQCIDLQYRLPTNLRPRHYDVDIKADIYQPNSNNFTLQGWVTIHLECVDRTDRLVFHKGSRIVIDQSSILVKLANNNSVLTQTGISEDTGKEFYEVRLQQVLNVGDNITIFMNYSAPMVNDLLGFFWYTYKEGGQTKYMAATQFEPYKARYAFPCLDEPALKATFNITLWRKGWMTALSNTPLSYSILYPDGWMKDIFMKTPVPFPTYLIAFAVANFTYVSEISSNGHLMRHWGEPQYIDAGLAEYSKSIAGKGLDYYEDHFKVPYPLPKEDQIAVPGRGGAMENWGLITYGRSRLFWDPVYSTTSDLNRLTNTMYHEILHQWLGNVVTCEWWNDAWLNEAFARFYQHWAVEYFQPTWNAEHTFWRYALSRALHLDDGGTGHPLHNQAELVQTPAQDSAMFSSITYDKGGSVLRMIHHLVLGSSWNESMQTYVARFQYGNTNAYDLLGVWDEVATKNGIDHGVSMTEIMNTWILQQGYPLVTVTLQPSKDQIDVSQRWFLQNPDKPTVDSYPPPYEYTWEIPFTFVTSLNPTGSSLQWLHKDDRTFAIGQTLNGADDWILANYKHNGYFRVNYEDSNWLALIKQIATDYSVIDPLNRAQIIDDSFSIAREGSLDYTIALSTTQYLPAETEYIPWYAASLGFDYIESILDRSPDYEYFRQYMLNLVSSTYDTIGWDQKQDDRHYDIYLRELILDSACESGHVGCIQTAQTLFANWKANPTDMTIITPDQRNVVYCTAMRYGLPADWDFLFGRYQYFLDIDHFSDIRLAIRNALTCSPERWLLNRYFRWAADADSRILAGDRANIMIYVARNPAGRGLVWDYLDTNWDTAYYRTSVLTAVTESFSTLAEEDMLLTFINDHPPTSPSEKSYYDGVVVTVEANLKWRQANEGKIINWLRAVVG